MADRFKTDYKDEIVQGGVRTYNIVDKNNDVLERDVRIVPTYIKTQDGSKLGANDINAQNKLLNQVSGVSLLINRDFQVWQAGETISQGVNDKDTYGPDGWRFNIDAKTSCARESTNGGCYLSIGGANFGSFGQRIEMNKEKISILKGKKVTVSFVMRAINSTINNISIELAGNKSVKKSYNLIKGGNEYFEFTFNVDDVITSTTLPYLTLNVIKKESGNNFSASDVIYIKYVDLAVGEVAPLFVSNSYSFELSQCEYCFAKELIVSVLDRKVTGFSYFRTINRNRDFRITPTINITKAEIPYSGVVPVHSIVTEAITLNGDFVYTITSGYAGDAPIVVLTVEYDARIY